MPRVSRCTRAALIVGNSYSPAPPVFQVCFLYCTDVVSYLVFVLAGAGAFPCGAAKPAEKSGSVHRRWCFVPTLRATPQRLVEAYGCAGGKTNENFVVPLHWLPFKFPEPASPRFDLSQRKMFRRATFRVALAPISSLTGRRLMHDMRKVASLAMIDKKGLVVSREIEVTMEEPGDASVMLDKSEGFSIKRAIDEQIGLSLTADPEMVPLVFYHNSRHFAHRGSIYPQFLIFITKTDICFQQESMPYPRLTLNQDLPRQTSTNESLATLWTWGVTHCITLNGTEDREFFLTQRSATEKYQVVNLENR